ncbi:LTA synthase family protein [Vibrio variabilis]|uniref:LTA synthase family protein n=1 Tax=Vibrio variabilis TaxID=990271 RepID=UPI000DD91AD9|nr:LTA synthase family protein [Vibrio variabilis]
MILSLLKIVVTLALLSVLSKVTFLGWYEINYSDTALLEFLKAVLWGVRFDLTVSLLLTGLSLLLLTPFAYFKRVYQGLFHVWLLACGAWIIFSTMGDTIYLSQANRHVTVDLHLGKGMEFELLSTVATQYAGLIIGALAMLAAFILLLRRFPLKITFSQRWYQSVSVALVFIVVVVASVRGGFSDKPQTPMYAYKIGDINQARIAWSAPYAITYYSLVGEDKSGHRWTPEQSPQQMDELKTKVNPKPKTKVNRLKQHDVVLVLLESWTAYDMQSYGSEVNATPNFDALRDKSLSTEAFYSNGFRTVEGVFATMCSQPNPVGGSVAGTRLESMPYRCLPQLLKERGWETSFVQGSGQGMVGAFAQSLGFSDSYGKFEYPDKGQAQNYWGYMDDGIYDFALDKLASAGDAPQFVTINTGTTHDSYLPRESDYVFGDETDEQTRRSVLHHADQSLGRFVERLKAQTKRPTLLVLVADHTMVGAKNDLRHVSIPFLIHGINMEIPTGTLPFSASHKDVAPTVIDLLGGQVGWFSGQSLLAKNYQEGADFTVNNQFYWLANDKVIRINAESGQKEACYRVGSDTVSLKSFDCSESKRTKAMYENGLNYLLYSQQHLFDGSTARY